MSADPALDEYREWQEYVGLAIVRFGELEYISVKCLELLPHDRIGATAAKMRFAQRVDLILEILEARPEKSQYVVELMKGMTQAKKLAEKRNLIAHNPIMLEIYTNLDATASRTRYAIASARSGGEPINLEVLKEFAAAVDDLASSMWMSFNNEMKTSEHMWREK